MFRFDFSRTANHRERLMFNNLFIACQSMPERGQPVIDNFEPVLSLRRCPKNGLPTGEEMRIASVPSRNSPANWRRHHFAVLKSMRLLTGKSPAEAAGKCDGIGIHQRHDAVGVGEVCGNGSPVDQVRGGLDDANLIGSADQFASQIAVHQRRRERPSAREIFWRAIISHGRTVSKLAARITNSRRNTATGPELPSTRATSKIPGHFSAPQTIRRARRSEWP